MPKERTNIKRDSYLEAALATGEQFLGCKSQLNMLSTLSGVSFSKLLQTCTYLCIELIKTYFRFWLKSMEIKDLDRLNSVKMPLIVNTL